MNKVNIMKVHFKGILFCMFLLTMVGLMGCKDQVPAPYFKITDLPTDTVFNAAAGGDTVRIQFETGSEWKIEVPDTSWINSVQPSKLKYLRGIGNAKIAYAVKQNFDYQQRSTKLMVKVGDKVDSIIVIQGYSDLHILTQSPDSILEAGGSIKIHLQVLGIPLKDIIASAVNSRFSCSAVDAADSSITITAGSNLQRPEKITSIMVSAPKYQRTAKIDIKQIGSPVWMTYSYDSGQTDTIPTRGGASPLGKTVKVTLQTNLEKPEDVSYLAAIPNTTVTLNDVSYSGITMNLNYDIVLPRNTSGSTTSYLQTEVIFNGICHVPLVQEPKSMVPNPDLDIISGSFFSGWSSAYTSPGTCARDNSDYAGNKKSYSILANSPTATAISRPRVFGMLIPNPGKKYRLSFFYRTSGDIFSYVMFKLYDATGKQVKDPAVVNSNTDVGYHSATTTPLISVSFPYSDTWSYFSTEFTLQMNVAKIDINMIGNGLTGGVNFPGKVWYDCVDLIQLN